MLGLAPDIAEQMQLGSVETPDVIRQADETTSSISDHGMVELIDCSRSNNITTPAPAPAPSSPSAEKKRRKRTRNAKKPTRNTDVNSDSEEREESPILLSSDESSDENGINNSNSDDTNVNSSSRMTQYELERAEKIKQNNELLRSLGLDKASIDATLPTKPKRTRSAQHQEDHPPVPVRRSSRVSKTNCDSHPTAADIDDVSASLTSAPDVPIAIGQESETDAIDTGVPQFSSIQTPLARDEITASTSTDSQDKSDANTTSGETLAERSCQPRSVLQDSQAIASMRQAGTELELPLGVPSTHYESLLRERQQSLENPDSVTSTSLTPLPLDGELFCIFDLDSVKPHLRPAAAWIREAEAFFVDAFKGTTAKMAVRRWLLLEEKLGYPKTVSEYESTAL